MCRNTNAGRPPSSPQVVLRLVLDAAAVFGIAAGAGAGAGFADGALLVFASSLAARFAATGFAGLAAGLAGLVPCLAIVAEAFLAAAGFVAGTPDLGSPFREDGTERAGFDATGVERFITTRLHRGVKEEG